MLPVLVGDEVELKVPPVHPPLSPFLLRFLHIFYSPRFFTSYLQFDHSQQHIRRRHVHFISLAGSR